MPELQTVSELDKLLNEGNNLLNQINIVKSEMEGNFLLDVKKNIDSTIAERDKTISEFKNLQNYLTNNVNNITPEALKIYEQQLIANCQKLSDLDKQLSQYKQEYDSKSKELIAKSSTDLQKEMDNLLNELNKNTEKVGTERERLREEDAKNNANNLFKKNNYSIDGMTPGLQKIYIDEALGIYIMYDKVTVISETMKNFFKSANNVSDDAFKSSGYKGKDDMFKSISQIKQPGLPSLLSVFIDILVKAVGSFAKNFFALKNTVDLLAGLEIGEILGNAIPGIIKVISELKLFFTDTKTWMFKQMMSPLFDINIPIPAFKFDLGALIPMLPFKIPIPKIDPYDYLNKLTPFNVNADQSKVPSDWQKRVSDEFNSTQQQAKLKRNTDLNNQVNNLNKQIDDLTKKLDGNSKQINDLNKTFEEISKENTTLNSELENNKTLAKNNLSNEKLLIIENRNKEICKNISDNNNKITNLNKNISNIKLTQPQDEEKQKILDSIDKLKKQKEDILNTPELDYEALSKQAIVLGMNLNITTDLVPTLQSLSDAGVNIYDNDNLNYLEKIGYNFKNDNQIKDLIKLKDYGVKLNDSVLLKRLYDLGFNINDPNHLDKLYNMKKYGINITDTAVLNIHKELGFNINNTDVFNILNSLKFDLNININDTNILKRLNTLGFSYNNPFIIDRLRILGKYVDITKNAGYDNAIAKNVNFNNPFFEDVLRKYTVISLNFNNDNFNDTEKWIFDNVTVNELTRVQKIIAEYKILNTKSDFNKFIYFKKTEDAKQFLKKLIGGVNTEDILYKQNESTNTPYVDSKNNIHYNGNIYDMNNTLFSFIQLLGQIRNPKEPTMKTLTYIDNTVINWNTKLSNNATIVLNGINSSLNMTNFKLGDSGVFVIKEDTVGSRQLTFPINSLFPGGGSSITLTSTPNAVDVLTYFYDGTNINWNVQYNYTGAMDIKSICGVITGGDDFTTNMLKNQIRSFANKNSGILYAIPFSYFNDYINKYKRLNIFIDYGSLDNKNRPLPYPYKTDDLYYKYPKITLPVADNISEYEMKITLLKDFVTNKGWVIDGVKANDIINTEDYKKIADVKGLQLTTEVNTNESQINQSVLAGVYGNYDKLGLNIRDPQFNTKFKSFQDVFGVDIEGSVILNTKRQVLMTYNTDNKHTKTIDIGTTKPNPALFEDERTTITIKNIYDTSNNTPPPTQTIVQFDAMNQLGFNFQKSDYATTLNKLKGFGIDIKKFETTDVTLSLISLGFHLSNKYNDYWLSLLKELNFNYQIEPSTQYSENSLNQSTNKKVEDIAPQNNQNDSEDNIVIPVDVTGKLESLNRLGFHFFKDNSDKMLQFLISIGIDMKRDDYENAMLELNNFGINFNDVDWGAKTEKFKSLNINFSKKDWVDKMSNLTQLGIDFNDKNWLVKYNQIMKFKTIGLDYSNNEIRQKLAIMLQLGVDFDKPEDTYMQQIDGLVNLGIITIPQDIDKIKSGIIQKQQKDLTQIDLNIQQKQAEINGTGTKFIDDDINKKNIQNENISNKIDELKNSIKNNQFFSAKQLTDIENTIKESCSLIAKNNINVNDLNKKKITKNIEIVTKGKEKLQAELNTLLIQRTNIANQKPYLLNKEIKLTELEKFQTLSNMGVNFYDPKWKDNINELKKAGMDFSKPDWKDTAKKLLTLIPKNPILEWIKAIINTITTIVTMPLKTLFKFLKKILDFLKQLLGIPMNPLKIPNWAKGIITKFKDIISLIITLPTLKGITDFLFMSPSGLAMVDIFVPGFAVFMTTIGTKVKGNNSDIINLQKKSQDKKNQISDLKTKNKKENDKIKNDIDINTAVLAGITPDIIKNAETKLNNEKDILNNNINNLKKTSKTISSPETLNAIEVEIQNMCDAISDVNDRIKNNQEKYNQLKNKSKAQIQDNINNLNNQLNEMNDKAKATLNDLNNDLNSLDNSLNDKINFNSKLGDFCKWSENMDELINLLKGFSNDIANKPNTFKDDLNKNNDKINKLKENKKILDEQIQGVNKIGKNPIVQKQINDLNNFISDNNNKISDIENQLCSGKTSMFDIQFADLNAQLNNFKNQNSDATKLLNNKQSIISNLDKTLENKSNDLQKQIDDLDKQNTLLKSKSDNFESNKAKQLGDIEGVLKWLPVIINIICATPKLVVNIIIGILNSIAFMKNLPILWNFPYIV